MIESTVSTLISEGCYDDIPLKEGSFVYVFPLNKENLHWSVLILIVFSNGVGVFVHFDSADGMNNDVAEKLKEKLSVYLAFESSVMHHQELRRQGDGIYFMLTLSNFN